MDILNSRSSEVMSKAMDGLMLRHQALSSNLANVDTPGYKALRVDFEGQLQQALNKQDQDKEIGKTMKFSNAGMLELITTNSRHFGAQQVKLSEIQANAYQESTVSFRNDDSGVDVDTEMTGLAKNTMQYEALATMEGRYFSGMKDIIKTAGGI